jgi:RNA polymerase sigma factor (sigma-70 family)
MQNDTDLGGPAAAFPPTQCAVVAATASPDPEVRRRAYEALVSAYWKPIYKYIRIKWNTSNEDAKDLTQAFLTQVLEKHFFERYKPELARFRTYLRTCVDGYIANEQKSAGRIKRGGAVQHFALDFASAENEVALLGSTCPNDSDDFFYREWVRNLFELAVDRLRGLCGEGARRVYFALFESYDLTVRQEKESITYTELAAQFGLTTTQVTNYLAWARREFRTLVLEALRECTGNEEEFRLESRRLFGERKT